MGKRSVPARWALGRYWSQGDVLELVRDSAEWKTRASCASLSEMADVFFPEKPVRKESEVEEQDPDPNEYSYNEAMDTSKRICAGCPVRSECFTFGMVWESQPKVAGRSGVWGGTSPTERDEIAKEDWAEEQRLRAMAQHPAGGMAA